MEIGNTQKPADENGRHPPLGIHSAKMYIKACVDLYCAQINNPDFQHLSHMFVHPRGTDIKNFEANLKTRCRIAAEDTHADPGVGSIHDGYTLRDLHNVVKTYMDLKTNRHGNLRDRMVFLMNHNMLLRGEISRGLNLNLVSNLVFEDEGPTRCPCLVFMYNWGKNNPQKLWFYSGAIRNKDVNICTFGAVGLYLFYRFHVENEPFPDFTLNENWFNIKLVKARDRMKPIAPTTQSDSVTRIFDACNISSKKKTHASRGSSARSAEQNGMDAELIRQMGGWLKGAMEKSYLNTLPYSAIRVMNGFHREKGSFYLPRALVTPPDSLQKRIFPSVEHWLERMRTDDSCRTISGQAFLRLLVELRIIILQDAVLLKDDFPDHPLFLHEIFQSPEYKAFADESLAAINASVPPAEIEMRRIMPFVDERINNISVATGEIARQVSDLQNAGPSNEALDKLNKRIDDVNTRLDNVDSTLDRMCMVMERIAEKMDVPATELHDTGSNSSTRVATIGQRRPRNDDEDDEVGRSSQRQRVSTQYSLSHSISTVKELWTEWTEGLGNGLPSVEFMNREYKTKWRNSSTGSVSLTLIYIKFSNDELVLEKKFYSKRLRIINEIKAIAEREECEIDDAIIILEHKCTASGSLNALWKKLVAEDKAAKEARAATTTNPSQSD
jgi:hypothetical protein